MAATVHSDGTDGQATWIAWRTVPEAIATMRPTTTLRLRRPGYDHIDVDRLPDGTYELPEPARFGLDATRAAATAAECVAWAPPARTIGWVHPAQLAADLWGYGRAAVLWPDGRRRLDLRQHRWASVSATGDDGRTWTDWAMHHLARLGAVRPTTATVELVRGGARWVRTAARLHAREGGLGNGEYGRAWHDGLRALAGLDATGEPHE